MRNLIIILTAIAAGFVLAIGGLFVWMIGKRETEKNTARTEAARQARWAKPEENHQEPSITVGLGQHDLTFEPK
jgi:flagellar basal body-associated protein FliL